ncbi:elongator complex protein 5 [Exophiala viscosa]|uniref:Elongator complex protein 5 n=1 Tax=Exophiala viscosa TaxID=2486360 RepID=A0AAN6DW35_9EURO|nr:elongator complex protein 5 [Exophiala viscosa]
MAHTNLAHRRTHNLLLISKLLNQRDHASPFTLVLDTLEQSANCLLREYLRRSRLSKTSTIFLSLETFSQPRNVDYFIECYGETQTPERIARAVTEILVKGGSRRYLIIIDALTTLASISSDPASNLNLTTFLSSLLQPPIPKQSPQLSQDPPQVSLIAVYHTDILLPATPLSTTPYSPSPLSLLSYLATTIITVHSFSTLLAEKAAHARSLGAPVFGLAESVEGVVVGLKPRTTLKAEERGIVLELEHRRKSGRGVLEWYFLPTASRSLQASAGSQAFREIVTLLDDHPLFRKPRDEEISDQELSGMTFELGLTDRQRLEREGVVLPYFDAQKAGGAGEGGRILYDMGVEDDFDEEEDEI